MEVEGKVAVVTGAARGVGNGIARALARNGARLIMIDLQQPLLDQAVADMPAGTDVIGIVADVSNFGAMQDVATRAVSQFGSLHIGVLNAGVGGGNFADTDVSGWKKAIDVNLGGVVNGITAFLPGMIERGGEAYLLATASGAGAHGTMYLAPGYATTKMAILTLMETLYGYLRDKKVPVRCGATFPLSVRSALNTDAMVTHMQQFMPVSMTEPEEFGDIVVEGIRGNRFYISVTKDQDERIYGGRLAPLIDYLDVRALGKAQALVDRSTPDGHLWGNT